MQRNGGSRATVAVVMGGDSAEREISIQSGTQVLRALHALGYEARSLDYDDRFVDALRECKPDVAFIALHGPGGEDGHVQALLEYLSVPYGTCSISRAVRCRSCPARSIFRW
jgi:D-alanine-D-alanine ligase